MHNSVLDTHRPAPLEPPSAPRSSPRPRRGRWIPALAAAVLAVMYVRLPYGFGATYQDEGFHLGLAARHAFGDVAFRDEALAAFRAFDVVSGPLMRWLPGHSVLFWRWAGFLLQAGMLLGSLALLRPLLPRRGAALLAAALVLFAPYNLWVPWYGNLGPLLALLSCAFWLRGAVHDARRTAIVLGALGGLVFALCALVYTPLIAAAGLPVVVAAAPRRSALSVARPGTLAWLGGLAVGLGLIAGFMAATGLAHWFVLSVSELRSVPEYHSTILATIVAKLRGSGYFRSMVAVMVAFLILGIGWMRLGDQAARFVARSALAGFCVLGAMFIAQSFVEPRPFIEVRWMMLLSLAMSMFAIGVIGARAREVMSRLDFAAAALMLLWGAGIGSIVAMASAAGVRAYTAANWIVWPAAIAVITHSVAAQADAAPRRRGVLAGWLLGALLVCVSAAHLLTWSYDDGVPWSLHERFQQPRLRGIVSTPTRVREYDGIVTALRSRTSPGDYVLAFDDLWWINYLTDTRPPLRSVLIAPNRFPRALEERWLAEMDSAGRSPRWVVTRRPPVGATPLESFIRTRYAPAALVGDLQLWGIRAAGQPASNDVGAVGGH